MSVTVNMEKPAKAKRTNGDNMRQKTNEELALVFNRTSSCTSWVANIPCPEHRDCYRCWLEKNLLCKPECTSPENFAFPLANPLRLWYNDHELRGSGNFPSCESADTRRGDFSCHGTYPPLPGSIGGSKRPMPFLLVSGTA